MQRLSCAPAVGLVVWASCGGVQAPPSDGGTADTPPISDVLTGTLLDGCVVALHMDEPSWSGAPGEVKDSCGNDNPATATDQGLITMPNGVHGRAGVFSGGACLVIQNAEALHAGANGLTLSAWILPSQLNNDGGSTANSANGVISKRTDSTVDNEYSMSVWMKNNLYVDLDTSDNRFASTAVIQEKVWTQITLVYDDRQPAAQRVRLYINGGLDSTHAESTNAALAKFSSPLYIGCTPAPSQSTQQYFLGTMDEVVIWNRPLDDAEIGQWYGATKPAP